MRHTYWVVSCFHIWSSVPLPSSRLMSLRPMAYELHHIVHKVLPSVQSYERRYNT